MPKITETIPGIMPPHLQQTIKEIPHSRHLIFLLFEEETAGHYNVRDPLTLPPPLTPPPSPPWTRVLLRHSHLFVERCVPLDS